MSSPESSCRDVFVDVVGALSHDAHVSYAEEIPQDSEAAVVHMSVGNADVCLTHLEPQASHFTAECEFGPLPATRLQAAVLQLLEFNCDNAQLASMAFAVDSASGSVVSVQAIPIAGLHLEGLLSTLLETGNLAVAWLSSWHLQAPATAPGSSESPLVDVA